MKVINLRDIYPHYTQDCFIEVTDEVADLFSEFDHKRRLTVCVHTGTRRTTPLTGTTALSMRPFSSLFLRMSCMSVR